MIVRVSVEKHIESKRFKMFLELAMSRVGMGFDVSHRRQIAFLGLFKIWVFPFFLTTFRGDGLLLSGNFVTKEAREFVFFASKPFTLTARRPHFKHIGVEQQRVAISAILK